MLPGTLFKDRAVFEIELDKVLKGARLRLAPAVRKAILNALAERDETAAICRDKEGRPEADPDLRDTENVPLPRGRQRGRAHIYLRWIYDGTGREHHCVLEKEVKPYIPDAWINPEIRDNKDGRIGKIGYEINFNRYFYKYQPPRPLAEIEADIKILERDILELLHEVAG